MPRQLDILALEPFFGGARRAMLEILIRCSRHRWTLLKLPPRRIERRLSAAANWFGEQLTRHWAGSVDLLFTSEALNLANLYRIIPALARQPAVVYFHSNQLPKQGVDGGALELVNLNTATAATEIWFNTDYHKRLFFGRVDGVIARHSELSSRNPLPAIREKAQVMSEPIDLGAPLEVQKRLSIQRDPAQIFLETRDADVKLLNEALLTVAKARPVKLITVGPVELLSDELQRRTVSETDDAAQLEGLATAGTFISGKRDAVSDYQAARAMTAGCQPLLPNAGIYPEMLPEIFHDECLYEPRPEMLAEKLEHQLDTPAAPPVAEFRQLLRAHEALTACRAFDERLQQLVESGRSSR